MLIVESKGRVIHVRTTCQRYFNVLSLQVRYCGSSEAVDRQVDQAWTQGLLRIWDNGTIMVERGRPTLGTEYESPYFTLGGKT